jgi:hypothetical protein
VTEKGVKPTLRLILLCDNGASPEIVFEVIDLFFAGAETQLEPPQTFVAHRGPAQVKVSASGFSKALYCFPHDQIIRAQVLKGVIRGAKLVNGVFLLVKKDCGSYGSIV